MTLAATLPRPTLRLPPFHPRTNVNSFGELVEVPPADASRVATSSLERDLCRRRRTRQKGPEDDISAQRPEIGDHYVREMAAKTAFLLASGQLRVSARTWDPLIARIVKILCQPKVSN
jgi:hypothetical protein